MKPLEWSPEKNAKLQSQRGFSFEDIQIAIEEGKLLDIVRHHNLKRYPNQWMLIVALERYAYAVPFIEKENALFLKTAFPSRKYTKKYLQTS